MQQPYRPEPLTDYNGDQQVEALGSALSAVAACLGESYPLRIGGTDVWTDERIVSRQPCDPDVIIGSVSKADAALAERAIAAAHAAFPMWASVAPEERAAVLFKAAALLRQRKHIYNAWLMVEAGKTRSEADADTAEAIDFLEYYGRQMLELTRRGEEQLVHIDGELNELTYIPLGVGVVISPWNFPLAIMAGMTTAALVTGNTVVLKPASATPVIAYHFVKLLEEAGLPAGAVQYVPGSGADIGDLLVQHPLVRFVSFTGSKEVGVRMSRLVAQVAPGQHWLKRFIGELGGKDAIIVLPDADLDAAAKAIVASAFGYSGQKCSACSRAILHKDCYDEVLERCVQLANRLQVGSALDAATQVGPVINEAAYRKILKYFDIAKQEGRIAAGGGAAPGRGYLLQPTIVEGVNPEAVIMQEEVFGPLLAVCKADDAEHALKIANDTEFGLTGSIFTRDRKAIAKAKRDFHVGNLYINRKCTGAVVGAHPFGGFNMSGTDSKAGGPDYLLLFTQPKLIAELL
ncbi:L-glutamate gamma-semialdehyde dehydrogenase [Paenibacillus chartarius]|uniref:L-glutamate gamma-semialdehyde dehydrogenase n=1 Tax=Paenibacillus chartarius TaxID=747481 RepID=A0ABV6DVI5_9BACL